MRLSFFSAWAVRNIAELLLRSGEGFSSLYHHFRKYCVGANRPVVNCIALASLQIARIAHQNFQRGIMEQDGYNHRVFYRLFRMENLFLGHRVGDRDTGFVEICKSQGFTMERANRIPKISGSTSLIRHQDTMQGHCKRFLIPSIKTPARLRQQRIKRHSFEDGKICTCYQCAYVHSSKSISSVHSGCS